MRLLRLYGGFAVAAALWLALAGPAVAGLHNATPADGSGDPNDQFVDNDALFAYTTTDVDGGYVCVVEADAAPDARCGGWGKTRVVGIGTQFTLLEADGLPPGLWRLQTVDEKGKNGEPGGEFFVRPCAEGDGDCDNTISLVAVSEAKEAANALGIPMAVTCLGFAVNNLRSLSDVAWGVVKDYHERHANYDGAGALAMSASIIPVGAQLGLGFVIEALDLMEPSKEKALSILKDLSCSLTQMYSDIAADPPDPDFTTVMTPTFSRLRTDSDAISSALMAAFDLQTGYGETMLKAFERYQGALAAGEAAAPYAHAQAAALGRNGLDQVSQMHDAVDALRAKAMELDALPEFAGPVVTVQRRDDLAAVYARVRTTGFTIDEIAQLTSLGLTSAQIDAVRSQFTPDPSVLPLDTTLQTMLRNLATALESAIPPMDRFARNASVVAGRTNIAPTASYTATPASGPVPLTVDFASTSTSPDLDELDYAWDFGDGTVGTGPMVSHTYATAGTFVTSLTVSDGIETATATRTISAGGGANSPPLVSLPAATAVDEGISFVLTPDASDPDGTIASYAWDLGDGRTSDQPTLSTSYPDEGAFTVKLTVTDDLGATATATTVVTVRNVAPTVLLLTPTFSRVPPGAARFFTAVAGDSGEDTLTYAWDFGDGTTGTGSTVSHAWATTGVYTLSVRVDDDDGGTATATHGVTVAQVTADAGPDVTIDEGGSATLGGPGSSPADGLTSHQWDFGDGESSGSGQHAYRDDGTYQAKLTVTDDVGSANDEATVVVRNVAPTIKGVAAPKETPRGTVSSFRAFVIDPGVDDTFSASWDFGDGGDATGLAADHTYSTAGSYTVQLRVEDDDGGVTTATRTILVVAAAAGVPDSHGRDFWIDFDDNVVEDSTKLTLFVTGVRATLGTVEIPGIGFATSFAVSANEITQVAIPLGAMLGQQTTRGVEPRAIHVTADDDVVVYGLNRTRETTDAYLAQPTDTQGTRYRVMGYGGLAGSLFSVVASRNGTDVTITPAVAVDEHAAGAPFTVRLNAGETYELEATAGFDLTGTLVASTAPVAVFGGHRCAFVPADFFACNHLIEQLPPVTAWGRSYVTAPLAGRRQDTLRILADTDATTVVIQSSGGSESITLNAGQKHEFLTGEPTSITADRPVLVAQFSNGSQFDDTLADPFMAIVPPYEQYLTSYVVATPADGFRDNFLNLITLSTATGGVLVDGASVPAASWKAIPGSAYSTATFPVPTGTHRIAGSSPVGVTVYGYDVFDAYGYVGGTGGGAVATLQTLALTPPEQTKNVGEQACVTVAAKDQSGAGLGGIRIDLTVVGVVSAQDSVVTTQDGTAPYCLTSNASGIADIAAAAAGLSAGAKVTWATESVNHPPVASDGTAATDEDTAVVVNLSATDADGDPLTFAIVDGPLHGVLSGFGATRTYTPAANYNGPDSFTFRARDAVVDSNLATVSLTVRPVNDAPVANDDSVVVDEDTTLAIPGADLRSNDTDVDGDSLSIAAVSDAEHGVVGLSDGVITYTPAPGYNGPAAFVYTISDGHGGGDTARVAVTVRPADDPPTADGLTVATDEDTAVPITLTGSDPDGDALMFAVVTGPAHGTLSGIAPALAYTPAADYHGSDSFTYRVSAGSATSPPATVAITVRPVNDAPRATDAAVTTPQDVAVVLPLVAVDVDGDALTYTVVGSPAHGLMSGSTYTPDSGYRGPDTVTFRASDGVRSDDGVVEITVTPVNAAPVAADGSAATDEDTPVLVSLDATDSDGDALTYAVVGGPAHGTLSGSESTRTYTPAADYNGSDSFTFTASDGALGSNVATVTLTVRPSQDAPRASDGSASTDEDVPLPLTLVASDVDGDALTFTTVDGPAHGTLTGAGTTRAYTPAANYHGPDSFTFRAGDGTLDSNIATVSLTVRPVNDAPTCTALVLTVDQGVAGEVAASCADVDGDALTPSIAGQGSKGVASIVGGKLHYAPQPAATGADAFQYRAGDGHLQSGPATVSVTIKPAATPVNDPPRCADSSVSTTTTTPVSGVVRCTDADGDPVSYALAAGPAHGSLTFGADGSWRYTAASGFLGTDSFRYTAADGRGGTGGATVTITVVAAPDRRPPTCKFGFTGVDPYGRKIIDATVRDAESGIASITVTKAVNVNVQMPAFTVGTTLKVVVRSIEIDPSIPNMTEIEIRDAAGNRTICDPIVTKLERPAKLFVGSKPTVRTFVGLPQQESRLRILNGRPGLTRVDVLVNGRLFRLGGLRPGKWRYADLARAMKPGRRNTIVFRAYGPARGTATVMVTD